MQTHMLMNEYQLAKTLVEQWGQAHLLRFYDGLKDGQKEALVRDILAVDFAKIAGLYQSANAGNCHTGQQYSIEPLSAIDKGAMGSETLQQATTAGMDAVRRGQYAVVTMAGGQGTRLGHSGPKGAFVVALDRPRSLFELQLDQIRGLADAAGVPVPWYIMTSGENHDETVAFFEQNGYFGYGHIFFFRQSSLPMVGLDGKLLLETAHSIKQGPDGNGSIFQSLNRSGMAADMGRRGVKWFFVCNVDNILARCGDPLPIGIALRHGVPCVSKSVMKRSPGEKAGVFCRIDGRPAVVEYTEVSPEMASLTDENGQYVYGDAHISCTLFSTDVLGLVAGEDMPYHAAVKKAPYLDDAGAVCVPEQENAYKFEAFIFDMFPRSKDIAVLRVDRNEEFAPIKNATGEDSVESAMALYRNAQKM